MIDDTPCRELMPKLGLDFRVFSNSVYSIGAGNAEMEHLLKESNIKNPGYFVKVIVMEVTSVTLGSFF